MVRKGLAVSAGAAVAPALKYQESAPRSRRTYGETAQQRFERYLSARETARQELEQLAAKVGRTDDDRAELLLAQCTLLDDPDLDREIRIMVENLQTDVAVEQVYQNCANLLSQMEDPYIRARSTDYLDLCRRVLRILGGCPGLDWSELKQHCILVAEELPPSVAAVLNPDYVLGIVAARGGATGHTAIMARGLGIPAVLGIENVQDIQNGTLVALEALPSGEGTVWLDPEEEAAALIREQAALWRTQKSDRQKWLPEKGRTLDGTEIQVWLNLSDGNESELTMAPYVEGVGLFRTEFLYLEREQPPTEEEQYQCYRRVLEAFQNRPVTLRTMDIGGDKVPSYLSRELEETNARGLHLSLQKPDLFRTQLRAALRAGVCGRLRLMLPMVTSLEELDQAQTVIKSVENELHEEGCLVDNYELGVMIEVPELARIADQVARRVVFASLGTNDLCQYLFSADRNGPDEAQQNLPYHPDLLSLIRQAVEVFEREGKDISLCGELAGDPLAEPLLVGLGLRKLSVAPGAVASLKQTLAAVSLGEAKQLAQEALAQESGAQVKAKLLQYQEAMNRV